MILSKIRQKIETSEYLSDSMNDANANAQFFFHIVTRGSSVVVRVTAIFSYKKWKSEPINIHDNSVVDLPDKQRSDNDHNYMIESQHKNAIKLSNSIKTNPSKTGLLNLRSAYQQISNSKMIFLLVIIRKQFHPVMSIFQKKQSLSNWSFLQMICLIAVFHSLHKKIKFSIKDFFSKCDLIRRKLLIW